MASPLSGKNTPPDGTADAAARGARNVAVMTGGRLATHAVLVLSAFAIPRFLGAETYGRYAATMAVVHILLGASAFGLALVEMRYFAPLWRGGDRERALDLGSSIWGTRLALSVAAAVVAGVWLALSSGLALGQTVCVLAGLLCGARAMLDATHSLFLSIGRAGLTTGIELLRVTLVLTTVLVAFSVAGLLGVFAAMPVLHLVLFAAAAVLLLRAAPLSLARFRWSALAPHLGFSLASWVGGVAGIVQAQFAVYAVASWVAPREAGYLAFGVQLFAFIQGLFGAARRSLFPILAELESQGETRRLGRWGGLMMRYATAASCVAVVSWGLVGEWLIETALTAAFLPAHRCGLWMLVSVMLYCAAGSANSLLYLRARPRIASGNLVLFAGATIGGLVVALVDRPADGAALRIAWVYAAAAGLFFASAVTTLRVTSGLVLPVARSLLLMAPAALAWPATTWDAALPARLATLAAFGAAYLAAATTSGLLPAHEIREITATLRRRDPRRG